MICQWCGTKIDASICHKCGGSNYVEPVVNDFAKDAVKYFNSEEYARRCEDDRIMMANIYPDTHFEIRERSFIESVKLDLNQFFGFNFKI